MSIIRFLAWLQTVSNPADINRFQSHTGKYLIIVFHQRSDSAEGEDKVGAENFTRLLADVRLSTIKSSQLIDLLQYCVFQNQFLY